MNKSKVFNRKDMAQGGFTLIEIMVSLMIFSIVVVVALAALVKIIDANKKAQSIHDAVVSLSFVMESMSRELRTGSYYYCKVQNTDLNITSIPGPAQDISACASVEGSDGVGVSFAFLSSRSVASCPATSDRLLTAYSILPIINGLNQVIGFNFKKGLQTSCEGALSFSPVIPSDLVTIDDFYVQMNDLTYPLALINLSGEAGVKENVKTTFKIQTASSARIPAI